MRLIAACLLIEAAAFLALGYTELTEPYEPGGVDSGAEWRVWAGVIVLLAFLAFMAWIAIAGLLDDIDRRRIARGLPTRAEGGRHRRQYAPEAVQTFGTPSPRPVLAYDRSGPTLPVLWVNTRTPVEVVLDEQPTGGER